MDTKRGASQSRVSRGASCLFLVGLLAVAGCDYGFFPEQCPPDISLSANRLTVKMGRTARLKVVNGDAGCRVYWVNTNAAVALVHTSNDGAEIRPRRPGATRLRAYRGWNSDGPSSACDILIVAADLKRMIIEPDTLVCTAGQWGKNFLTPVFVDDENVRVTLETGIVWESLDPSVAEVGSVSEWPLNQAHIRGLEPGTARIRASYTGEGTGGQTLAATALVLVVAEGDSPPSGPRSVARP